MRCRRCRLPRRVHLEALESRLLLSANRETMLPLVTAHVPASPSRIESSRDARPDLDALARHLVHHPREAAREGMGALATMLVDRSGYAQRHGWGESLAMLLTEHPA